MTSVDLTIPAAQAARIAGLNDHWARRGMPERCRLPTDAEGWALLLRRLPGYDPFATPSLEAEGLRFEPRDAVNAVGFYHEYLTHIKGEWAGKPVWLEPWQQAFLANLFGWKRADGSRRYRRYLLYVPRKNGKTVLLAGLMLHTLINDGEPGAEVYCGAADREQARLLFDLSRAMVEREPALAERLTCYQYDIVDRATHSKFRVLSADAHTKHGFNVHSAVLDELHAQPDRELYDVLETGTVSRRQPLMGAITTADYERPSVCNELHDHARLVRDGTVDDWQFLPAVYEAERGADPADPAVWRAANPNLGVSVSADYLRAAAERATREPAYCNTFLRLHLNIRTEQAEKWMDMQRWARCGEDPGEPGPGAAVAVDIASTEDFAAMVTAWTREDKVVGLRARFWIPEATAEARERRGVPVRAWIAQGWVTATEGERIHYDRIEAEVLDECRRVKCQRPAFDPWNAEHMTQHLADAGLEPVMFNQSMRHLSAPTKHLETLCAMGRLAHGGNPVLAWMMGNCTLERDGMDNIRPSKKRSPEKIDGVIASVMAIGMLINGGGESETESVYESRGLLVL